MDDQTLEQLNRRIDEHHAYLRERLDELAGAVRAVHEALLARLTAHDAYHQQSEHKWGAIKLAGRYPFRLAALVFAVAGAMATAPESSRWLGALARQLIGLLCR